MHRLCSWYFFCNRRNYLVVRLLRMFIRNVFYSSFNFVYNVSRWNIFHYTGISRTKFLYELSDWLFVCTRFNFIKLVYSVSRWDVLSSWNNFVYTMFSWNIFINSRCNI